jgi:nucleoid DNA-binding protein
MGKPKFTRRHLWAILEAACMNRDKAASLTSQIINAMAAALAAGETVELRGLGTFEPRERRGRTARNPRTGEAVIVPARRYVFFRPCGKLKKAVSAAPENGEALPE